MARMYELCLDVKQWPAGGWEVSKTRAKVNGRWTYFFAPDQEEPWNAREPVDFSVPYVPPNHQGESFSAYPEVPAHPIRRACLRAHDRVKAPLSGIRNSQSGHSLPPAACQKITTFAEPEVPIWQYQPFVQPFPKKAEERRRRARSFIEGGSETEFATLTGAASAPPGRLVTVGTETSD
jgi:hypothetical protein